MMQKYSIFTNDHSLNFVEAPIDSQSIKLQSEGQIEKLLKIYGQLLTPGNAKNFEVCSSNPAAQFELYSKLFTPIAAAGGVVFDKQGKLLWIHRLNKWDLPKGKLEKGETIAECALREVAEECGLSLGELSIVQPLPNSYHTYVLKEKNILKTTYWFEMLYTGSETGTPQLIEDISKVAWLNKEETNTVALQDTYANIKAVFASVVWK